jgi:hypothetical protein
MQGHQRRANVKLKSGALPRKISDGCVYCTITIGTKPLVLLRRRRIIYTMYTFIELPVFSRYAADYFSDDDLAALQVALANQPEMGDVVPGTHGVRKVRWGRTGMGKQGGVRVLYYLQDARDRIWLLTVYAKSARENISVKTLNLLREFADHAEFI